MASFEKGLWLNTCDTMNFARPLSVTTSPYSVTGCRRPQTRRPTKAHALLLPAQVLTAVCGDARVPSAVRERLLVTFMTQQRELKQQHQRELEQKQDKLDQQQDKLDQQQDKLEREIRERSQWQLAAKDAQHLVHNRTTELLVLKGCMNLRRFLSL